VATDLATGAVIRPSLNNGGAGQAQTAWDKMRVVITLDQFDADFMTGTMDYFITVGSTGVEHQVTNDEPVIFAEIADNDELTPYNDSTVPQITIQKGPFSGATYYDNIYIGDPAPIPEPSTLALGGVFGLLALRRARRRRC
jgi:hypothetical protein